MSKTRNSMPTRNLQMLAMERALFPEDLDHHNYAESAAGLDGKFDKFAKFNKIDFSILNSETLNLLSATLDLADQQGEAGGNPHRNFLAVQLAALSSMHAARLYRKAPLNAAFRDAAGTLTQRGVDSINVNLAKIEARAQQTEDTEIIAAMLANRMTLRFSALRQLWDQDFGTMGLQDDFFAECKILATNFSQLFIQTFAGLAENASSAELVLLANIFQELVWDPAVMDSQTSLQANTEILCNNIPGLKQKARENLLYLSTELAAQYDKDESVRNFYNQFLDHCKACKEAEEACKEAEEAFQIANNALDLRNLPRRHPAPKREAPKPYVALGRCH